MTVQPTRDQLRALADAATPGPWEWHHQEHKGAIHPTFLEGRTEDDWVLSLDDAFTPSRATLDFIAAARTAVPHLLDQLDQAEAELDSWMTRAYEAEKRAWQAEARIKHLEDTARVLVKETLNAEAERDSARGYISELETAVQSRNDVIKHRDAQIKAVRDALDQAWEEFDNVDASDIRRALEG